MSLGIISKIARGFGLSAIKAKGIAPSVMTYGGIAGMAVGSFMLAKRMPKVKEIIEERRKDIEDLGEEDIKAAMKIKRRTIVEILKEVSLPVGIMITSAGAIIGGHNMLRKDVLGLIGVNSALEARHTRLLNRVKEEMGAETADEWENGIRKSEAKYLDENGKEKIGSINVTDTDPMIFDELWFSRETSDAYKQSVTLNHSALGGIETLLTNRLHTKGYVTMLELLEELGMYNMIKEYGPMADRIGWLLGEGDNEVKLRLELNDAVIKGVSDVWILRPNHDGDIKSKIQWKNTWPKLKKSIV